MGMLRIIVLFLLALSFAATSSAELTADDLATFKQLRKDTLASGDFRVLEKSPLKGDLHHTPFQSRIAEIEKALLETGISPMEARKEAVRLFLEELRKKGSSVVTEKSLFRSGGFGDIGKDFCHPITGACLSQTDPSLMGKRPSRGQLPYFFPGEYKTQLDTLKLEASLKGENQPWSDDYWPIKKGILGSRYADRHAAREDWPKGLAYVLERGNHLLDILILPEGEEKQQRIQALSPGEKYDLLIGHFEDSEYEEWFKYLEDPKYSEDLNMFGLVAGHLTPNHWRVGQAYYNEYGEVESWMGICHGWATASIHMPRPQKTVTVKAFDGRTEITFYPSDIKALGSLLWAESAPRSRFIGGRCDSKEVETDPETGAILDEKCFDTNPADWHLVTTNYVGEMQQSFIMDATFDYAVWNQPVLSYSYGFFNPTTGEPGHSLQDVLISWEDYQKQDPFKNVRGEDPKRRYIVGVNMRVDYLAETKPSHNPSDSYQQDRLINAFYLYDLELDEHLNVIGGEWYQNQHPDFLWSHDKGQKAISRVELYYAAAIDQLLFQNYPEGKVSFQKPLQTDLTEYAKVAAERGEVVDFIISALFAESAQ